MRLTEWRAQLIGLQTPTPFSALTDHRALEYFSTKRELTPRQMRWVMKQEELKTQKDKDKAAPTTTFLLSSQLELKTLFSPIVDNLVNIFTSAINSLYRPWLLRTPLPRHYLSTVFSSSTAHMLFSSLSARKPSLRFGSGFHSHSSHPRWARYAVVVDRLSKRSGELQPPKPLTCIVGTSGASRDLRALLSPTVDYSSSPPS